MLLWGITLLFGYAIVSFGSVNPVLQVQLSEITIFLWVLYLATGRERQAILLDPLTYLMGAFILFILCQHINSGQNLLFYPTTGLFALSKQLHPNFPWGLDSVQALQPLHVFFPTFSIILLVKHGLDKENKLRLINNITLLGFLSILYGVFAHFFLTPGWIYGWIYSPEDSFGCYGYVNTAADFFLLLLCSSLLLYGRFAFISFVGIFMVACRSVQALSLLLLYIFLIQKYGNVLVKKVCFSLLIPACLFGYLLVAPGVFESRGWQYNHAMKIIKDYPVYGIGGGGYSVMCQKYASTTEIPKLRESGRANIHNDFLQYAVEYGWIGMSILAAIVAFLIYVANSFFLLGIGLVGVHSMIDISFRVPLTLMFCGVLLVTKEIK